MAIDFEGLSFALQSFAQRSGYFDQVNGHDSDNPPGHGLICDTFLGRITTCPGGGLSTTNALVELMMIFKMAATAEPTDADYLDPHMVKALNAVWAEIFGDFDLSTGVAGGVAPGTIKCVDLERSVSAGPTSQPGWAKTGRGEVRTMTISIPVIVNDAWDQAA